VFVIFKMRGAGIEILEMVLHEDFHVRHDGFDAGQFNHGARKRIRDGLIPVSKPASRLFRPLLFSYLSNPSHT